MKSLTIILATALASFVVCGVASAQVDVKQVAHAVDEHYNALKTLKAAFTESYLGPGMSRSESGTLWLKKPGRMRWDYDQPRPKLFITDGKTAWFYVPGERQARRTHRNPSRHSAGQPLGEKKQGAWADSPTFPS